MVVFQGSQHIEKLFQLDNYYWIFETINEILR